VSDNVLELEGVATYRGRVQILWDVSLHVARGETVAVVGPNGAGKTTLLGSILGLFPPANGRVRVLGEDVTGAPPEAIARRRVAVVPERRQLFGPLSVRENLLLGAFARRDRENASADLEEVLELFPPLRKLLRTPAGSLSGGEQQMVAIGRALMAKPELLLLDEPSLGLAPRVRAENFAALGRLAEGAATIVLVEQNLRMAARICRRAYFMERGRIVATGNAEDLVRSGRTYFMGPAAKENS
jgi:branched-chain amino acid transport system ATP-binding protein